MLAARLLGPLTILLNEQPITNFVSRKAEALLAYLVFTRATHSRETIAELLWGERTTSQAQSNLRVVLSNLRKLVGDYLVVTRHTVGFNVALPFTVDVATLYDIGTPIVERLERDGAAFYSRPQAREMVASDVVALQTTLNLYTDQLLMGMFLPEAEGFEGWLLRERSQVEAFVTRAYDALLATQLAQRAYPSVIANANRLLSIVPWHERAYQSLMMAHARTGDLTTALAVYQRCQQVLQEELAAPPSAPTTRLYLQIRAARTTPVRPLPIPPTPLVGRDDEVNEILELLQDSSTSLVTIIGMGGVGKTRIAIAVASALHSIGRFLHGVHFLRLEAISPSQFPATLAATLGITLQANRPVTEQISAALQDKEMLMVLDNLETLLTTEAGDEVRTWLSAWIAAAPEVKWLTTSQMQVRLREEILVDIEGLPFPDPKAIIQPQPTESAPFGAITLFLQSATRHQRKYSPNGDWHAIVRLTQLVEGLPLALEMAGASMRDQSCKGLVIALEHNLDELRSPHANVPRRHLGMRAIFVHAWASLSRHEQDVLSRLAYLRGAFRPAAAIAIANATARTLNDLTTKSMVRYDSEATDPPYSLHSLMRAFALEHLSADPDLLQVTGERHALYYTARLTEHYSALLSRWKEAHLTLMDEFDSIHTALLWCIEGRQWHRLATCIEAMYLLFMYGAQFEEGERLLGLADHLLQSDHDPAWKALHQRIQLRRIGFMIEMARTEEAEHLLNSVFPQLEDYGNRALLAMALIHQSRIARNHGHYEQAQQYAERVIEIPELQQDPYSLSFAYRLLAVSAEKRGDYAGAEGYSRQALAFVEPLGNSTPNLLALRVTLANILQAAGKLDEAEAIYREGLALAEQLGITSAVAILQTNLGILLWKQGQLSLAKTILLESIAVKQVLGNPISLAISKINLGEVYTGLEQFEQARHTFYQAITLTRDAGNVPMLLEAVMGVAAMWVAEGQKEVADSWLRLVAHHPQATAEIRTRAEQFLNAKLPGSASTPDTHTIVMDILAKLETRNNTGL
jgi:DNA-binding SARP family transcriptional activator/predicted ATPase